MPDPVRPLGIRVLAKRAAERLLSLAPADSRVHAQSAY